MSLAACQRVFQLLDVPLNDEGEHAVGMPVDKISCLQVLDVVDSGLPRRASSCTSIVESDGYSSSRTLVGVAMCHELENFTASTPSNLASWELVSFHGTSSEADSEESSVVVPCPMASYVRIELPDPRCVDALRVVSCRWKKRTRVEVSVEFNPRTTRDCMYMSFSYELARLRGIAVSPDSLHRVVADLWSEGHSVLNCNAVTWARLTGSSLVDFVQNTLTTRLGAGLDAILLAKLYGVGLVILDARNRVLVRVQGGSEVVSLALETDDEVVHEGAGGNHQIADCMSGCAQVKWKPSLQTIPEREKSQIMHDKVALWLRSSGTLTLQRHMLTLVGPNKMMPNHALSDPEEQCACPALADFMMRLNYANHLRSCMARQPSKRACTDLEWRFSHSGGGGDATIKNRISRKLSQAGWKNANEVLAAIWGKHDSALRGLYGNPTQVSQHVQALVEAEGVEIKSWSSSSWQDAHVDILQSADPWAKWAPSQMQLHHLPSPDQKSPRNFST
eukprot:3100321-Amphidinium_carterae.8